METARVALSLRLPGSTNVLLNTRLNPWMWDVFPFVFIFPNLVGNVLLVLAYKIFHLSI